MTVSPIGSVTSTNPYFIVNRINKASAITNKSSIRLVTGKKINSAADNPSGLAQVQRFISQINALNVANDNISSATGLVRTADKTLESVTDIAQNINELYIQMESDTLSDTDKAGIQTAIDTYAEQIGDILGNSKYNDMSVFSGKDINIQAGANAGDSMAINVSSFSVNGSSNTGTNLDFTSLEGTQKAIDSLTAERAKMGAYENVMEYRTNINSVAAENLENARSQIEDADLAEEAINYNQGIILQQMGSIMLQKQMQNDSNLISMIMGS